MARAGRSVAVLERGEERWPGEYPVTLAEAAGEVHASGNLGHYDGPLRDLDVGKPTGLYHLIVGEGQNAFVANGLGGTSLLNANVFLECDRRTLELPAWPPEIRNDPSTLDAYYAKAAEMLQPAPYPADYPPLRKLAVLEKQAAALGQAHNFYRVPQTTFFRDGLNSSGVRMKASTGSGQDCTGVNDGSKSSVLMNYLPDAWNRGAEIFCECEVRYVHADPRGGYVVFFAWHGDDRSAFKEDFYNTLMWVRARELCFLGAGALGTTEILLRSQAHGLPLSRAVGQKMSGNGDILSFGYNTDQIVNGIGRADPPAADPPGPTITGVIDNRGPDSAPNVLDGYVIEEGAIPQALGALLQSMLELLPGKQRPRPFPAAARLRHLLSATQTRLLGPYSKGGAVNRTQTYLIMSHDSNEAILSLQNDKPYLQFLGVGRTEHVKTLNNVLAKATTALGGTFVNSPFFAAFHQQAEITVHALGGAAMSPDGTGAGGATDHFGRLFTGDGAAVHSGLVCVDGAAVPTALGVNPFATITALAERSVHSIAQERGWAIDTAANGALDLFGLRARTVTMTADMRAASAAISAAAPADGVRYSEIMDGYIHVGDDIGDFVVAENVAKGAASAAKLYMSVDVYSVRNLTHRDERSSFATGSFSCGALSRDPLLVLRGDVQFFSADQSVSDGSNLVYRLTLLSTSGETYILHGYKTIDAETGFSAAHTWTATTTLYTTLTTPDGALVGRGILRISWRNFAPQLKTLGSAGGVGPVAAFVGYFMKRATSFFFGPLRTLQYPSNDTAGYYAKIAPAKTIPLTASDGVGTTMKMWLPQAKDAAHKPKRPLLLIPGASVDDQIFSLPTIPVNAVEYFTALGYQVYVPIPRFGRTPAAELGYTVYDARLDVLAAMQYVHAQHEMKMYVVCHCQGAVATAMGILDGTLTPAWIQGMAVSQVFFKQQFAPLNATKARTSLFPRVYQALAGPWFPMSSSPSTSSAVQGLLDQLLRFYPVGPKSERCSSTVCHRGSLCYGRMWSHANLTHATHARLGDVFGGVHMRLLTHVMRMGIAHEVMDNEFNSLVTDANLRRFAGLPILFLSGGASAVYSPESTSMSYDALRELFGTALYERRVLEGYGHLDTWMGKRSNVDVYPFVAEHVKRCEQDING
ncbi:hypothetical protein GGX14DRAFT_454051 [Mycena pura]|uniref:Cholesterol oxidase n=1 Tax=Mycena pura TaxID=153505 RepID=A0AAD6VC45_9AGAR|nr:hypothetical protein GGX14DRAFT_454051 [Mycena pura]